MTAASDLGPSEDGDAIYALTDGGENASKVGENVLREELLRRSIRLFTLSVNTFSGPTLEERSGPLVLKDMVQATGGFTVELPANVMGTPPTFTNGSGSGKLTPEGELLMLQFRQIFSFGRVEVQFPKPLDKAQDWNLKVKGLKGRDFTVVYPHKLAACVALPQSASLSK